MDNALWLNERELACVEKISKDASNEGIMLDFSCPGNAVIPELLNAELKNRDGRGHFVGDYMQTLTYHPGKKSVTTSIMTSKLDETLALQNPYSLILGMFLSAKAISANEIILFVGEDNQFIAQMLNIRIKQLEKMGYFKSYMVDFCVIPIKEEDIKYSQDLSLLSNYKESLSQARSPYQGVEEMWENSKHFILNVETFLNISLIIRNGSGWYKRSGKESNYGSKIFYVRYKEDGCLIEVDMGSTLSEMMVKIEEKINIPQKYVLQIGGNLGCYIKQSQLELEIDFNSFIDAGLLLGAGTVEVFESEKKARKKMESSVLKSHENSCGKCSVCREGTKRLGELVVNNSSSDGLHCFEKINYLGEAIRNSSLCGYGKMAINMIVSAANNQYKV
ncbi:MAG: hypothetical protein D5S00_06420 [Tindallia sp. MSAO_Bac2]|nr:MAG: hypothetical protein D5S00_06420 [Tindallia sp. MSAO_Bac2]